MDGVIVIDKPEGWTSHDVVNKVRRIAKTKKVGHLGTLDPIATGVLPLVIGRATRLAQFYTRSDKIYEGAGALRLVHHELRSRRRAHRRKGRGAADRPGTGARARNNSAASFCRRPPPVSAKKVEGRRAYELARKNIAVELPPSPVHVYELTVLELTGDLARLRATAPAARTCARSRTISARPSAAARTSQELRRLASGEFDIDQARTLEQLEALAAEDRLVDAIVPAAKMLPGFPSVFVDDVTVAQIRNGRNFPASPFRSQPAAKYVKAVTQDRRAGGDRRSGRCRICTIRWW